MPPLVSIFEKNYFNWATTKHTYKEIKDGKKKEKIKEKYCLRTTL
jgi:hypothetical protein